MSIEITNPVIDEEILALPLDPTEQFITDEQRQAFAEHVRLVIEKGDALETPFITGTMLGAKMLAAAAVVFPAGIVAGGNVLSVIAQGAILTIAAGVGSGYRHQAKEVPQAGVRMAGATQKLLGERYDLYSMPRLETEDQEQPPRLVMRYFGPLAYARGKIEPETQPETTLDHIQKMARLAQENGISELIVDIETTQSIVDADKLPDSVPMCDVLAQRGIELDPGEFEQDRVVVRPPEYWKELTQKKRFRLGLEDEMASLVRALRSVRPDHPLVGLHEQYAEYPLEHRRAMLRAIETGIQREFSDIGVERPSLQAQARGAGPERRAEYLDASVRGDLGKTSDITWKDGSGLAIDSASLEQALDMTPAEMQALLKRPETDPNRAVKLIMGLLSRQLLNGESTVETRRLFVHEEDEDRRPAPSFGGLTTQDILLPSSDGDNFAKPHRVNARPLSIEFARKLVVGYMIAGFLTVTAYSGSKIAQAKYDSEFARAKAEIAYSQGLDPATANIPEGQVRARVADQSPTARVWGWWRDYQGLTTRSGPMNSTPPKPAAIASSAGGVGNAGTNDIERTDWQLEANGGMSTIGYWTARTSAELDASDNGLKWIMGIPITTSQVLPPSFDAAPNTQSIKVSRTLSPDDFIKGYRMGSYRVRVPTLDKTVPVAANINGQAVAMTTLDDGTYGFEVEGKKDGQLEYWLQRSPTGSRPRAIAPVSPVGGYKGNQLEIEAHNLKEVWNKQIPGFSQLPVEQQIIVLNHYFHNEFNYKVNPFDVNFDHDATPLDQYVGRIIDGKKANCNVAATAMALSVIDPNSEKTVLNIAEGYLNSNDYPQKKSKLSSRELHMWNVFKDGSITDATPHKGITEEDQAFLNGRPFKREAQEDTLPWDLSLAVLGLGAIGVAVANRRRIPRAVRRVRARSVARTTARREQELLRTDEQTLHMAAEVADALLYDPSRNIANALRRAAESEIPQAAISLQRLRRRNMQTVANGLTKPQINTYRGNDRLALVKARRIIAKTGRLQHKTPRD